MAGAGSSARAPYGRVIVTGAGGFIGSALCAAFAAEGRAYEGWVREERHAIGPSLRFVGDLHALDAAALAQAFEGATAVVHAAGRAHLASHGRDDHLRLAHDNVELAQAIAGAARSAGVARFIHLSSVKVNGEASAPGRPFRPDDPPAPADFYARTKRFAEDMLVTQLGRAEAVVTILRLPMVYGAGARANFRALVDAVAARRWLPLASIDNRRRLLSLPNLVGAVRAALDAPGGVPGVHFVGDADAVSTPQLVRAIAAALGVEPRLSRMPVGLLRVAGVLTGRSAAIARLTQSLDMDIGSFSAATGWQPQPFGLTQADVGQARRG